MKNQSVSELFYGPLELELLTLKVKTNHIYSLTGPDFLQKYSRYAKQSCVYDFAISPSRDFPTFLN